MAVKAKARDSEEIQGDLIGAQRFSIAPLYLGGLVVYDRTVVSQIATYSIGAVARMVGVPPATLRTWEDRYGLVAPVRSPGGHRLYSREEVERLRFVADRVHEGLSPGDAHRLLETAGNLPTSPGDAADRVVILLAERDPYAAEFVDYFLKTEGFDVVLALDAADAEAALASDRPQLAIIDLLISGGAGLELCRTVQARGIPVLAVSSIATRDAALEAGAAAFLEKPLEPLRLVSAVKDLLGRSSFLREVVPAR